MRSFVRLLLALCGAVSAQRVGRWMRILFAPTAAKLRRAAQDPQKAQLRALLQVVGKNAQTVFGQAHRFAEVNDFDTYRARVPVSTYDDMRDDIERTIAGATRLRTEERAGFYAATSGTTGRSKYIPATHDFITSCKVTNRILFRTLLTTFPEVLQGKRLGMRSPSTTPLGEDSRSGSITVALGGGLERREHPLDAVPYDVFTVSDFSARYFLCLRFALAERVTTCAAVNPSTLYLFQKTLKERAPEFITALRNGTLGPPDVTGALDEDVRVRLQARVGQDQAAAARLEASIAQHGFARMADAFEHLVGLVCWKGGSAPFYLARLTESYGDLPVLDYGYAASEGIFGAPLSPDGAASVLSPHGHVFEFAPTDDIEAVRRGEAPTLLLHEVAVGAQYYVIVTTGAGLYRYDMNDVVTVVGRYYSAPMVVFSHKGGAQSSLTGEKLTEAHVSQAMARAQDELGLSLAGFCAAPLFPVGDQEGQYLLAIEDVAKEADLSALAAAFDGALAAVNEEYEAKRKSMRLAPAICVRLDGDATARVRAERVAAGAPDAHVKIPHLSPDGVLLVRLGLEGAASHHLTRLKANVAAVPTGAAREPA